MALLELHAPEARVEVRARATSASSERGKAEDQREPARERSLRSPRSQSKDEPAPASGQQR